MRSARGPILSELEHPEDDEAFGSFLLDLGESVDQIQEAELGGHLEEVAKRCGDLAEEGRRFKLPPLVEAAERARDLCGEGEREALRDALMELTDVVRRIRLASVLR